MESRRLVVLFSVIFSWCSVANAAGFQLAGHSVTQIGRATAGGSLAGDDLSAAFDNPAEMTLLENNRFQLGIYRSRVSFPFTNSGSTQNLLGPICRQQVEIVTGELRRISRVFLLYLARIKR
ncbi:MAG: hypothetical protein GXP17_09750 [Gammaproteobacteria bacterium]|nr:hypothetical protein [Gammaproteobacteria bacterium]